MDPLILLALLLVCLPLGYLAWSLLSADRKGQATARDILSRGAQPCRSGEEGQHRSAREDRPPPHPRRLCRRSSIACSSLAGRPANLPLGRVLAAKPALGLVGGLVGAVAQLHRNDADHEARRASSSCSLATSSPTCCSTARARSGRRPCSWSSPTPWTRC